MKLLHTFAWHVIHATSNVLVGHGGTRPSMTAASKCGAEICEYVETKYANMHTYVRNMFLKNRKYGYAYICIYTYASQLWLLQ